MSTTSKIVKKFFQYFILFSMGAITYYSIEVLFRGFSFPEMAVLGGLSLILVGGLNDFAFTYKMPIWLQMILGGLIITTLELICGLTLNKDYHIWDYRGMYLNFRGQICLAFSLIWTCLSLLAILVQDYFGYYFLGKPYPKYYWRINNFDWND